MAVPVRVIIQDKVVGLILAELTVAGILVHLSHMPLYLFEPHIGHQKCDTVVLLCHSPRYTGIYQTPTGPS